MSSRTQPLSPLALDRPAVRVRTLMQLRWAAVGGQLVTLVVVGLGLDFKLPWVPVLAAVAASISLNFGLAWLHRWRDRIDGREATLHLGFDLAQLGVLLFLTGGLDNPFALLLLVPVTISATLLSSRATLAMMAAALLILLALWRWALPLPWHDTGELLFPELYRAGIVIAIAVGMGFLSLYAWQVSAEARRRRDALVATQTALEREARMGALGALAAAAAHELGGPLGTITLIATDLQAALGEHPEYGHDIQLLHTEARRCREILAGIAERAEAEDPFPHLPLAALLREVIEPFEPTRVQVEIHVPWGPGGGPVVRRSPELLHGLNNLVSNALRHARNRVRLEAGENGDDIWCAVADDGTGFDPDLLPRLGEPFLGPSRSGSGSTGLGIFIATTLLERTGGRLFFANPPTGGARVELHWRRADIEAGANAYDKEGIFQ